ncbi:binding-protein dependent transport system inner membrane protein [Mesorhizobium amorphae CCNWGS0123]|uniref:Binding-protein dependent transport system inner membrane protein n=1 Tax=Mesorhizobium amorphae CCNWGS0123 TaxID=1082933 RepID=G6YE87_9HYPH|nr:binding-protein dependent transport system inner membrane protein [Mesorhizobium amorphae CCNWGS0123]
MAAMVLAFLMSPLIIIVLFSFKSSGDFTFPITGWSLKWYAEFFSTQTWMDALRNSLVLAVSTTLLATLLGTMAALGLAAPQLPGRRLISAFLLIPMIAPVVIVGVGMYFVFSMTGLTATFPGPHPRSYLARRSVRRGDRLSGSDRSRPATALGRRQHGRTTLPCLPQGDASGHPAGHCLGRTVCLRHLARRGGGDDVPCWPGTTHLAARNVHHRPRHADADHRSCRNGVDCRLYRAAGRFDIVRPFKPIEL